MLRKEDSLLLTPICCNIKLVIFFLLQLIYAWLLGYTKLLVIITSRTYAEPFYSLMPLVLVAICMFHNLFYIIIEFRVILTA